MPGPLAWLAALDGAIAGRIAAAGALRVDAAATAAIDQAAALVPPPVSACALPVCLVAAIGNGPGQANRADIALGTGALAAAASLRQRGATAAATPAAAAPGLGLGSAAPVLLANESAGGGTVQGNAVAIHLSATPAVGAARARTTLDQRTEGASLTAASRTAAADLAHTLSGRTGVSVVNQSAGRLGTQGNAVAIAQPVLAR